MVRETKIDFYVLFMKPLIRIVCDCRTQEFYIPILSYWLIILRYLQLASTNIIEGATWTDDGSEDYVIYRIVRYSNVFWLFDYYIPNRLVQFYIAVGICLFFFLNFLILFCYASFNAKFPRINQWLHCLIQQYLYHIFMFPIIDVLLHYTIYTTGTLALRICAGLCLIIPILLILVSILRDKVTFKLTSKDPLEKCRTINDYLQFISQTFLLALSKLTSAHALSPTIVFGVGMGLSGIFLLAHYRFLEYVRKPASNVNCIGIMLWIILSIFIYMKFNYPSFHTLWPAALLLSLLLSYASTVVDNYLREQIVFHENYLTLSIKDFILAIKLLLYSKKEGARGNVIEKHRAMMFLKNCLLSAKHLGKSCEPPVNVKHIIKDFQANHFEGNRGADLQAFRETMLEVIDVLFLDRLALVRSDRLYIELALAYLAFMLRHRKNPNRSYQVSMKIKQRIDNISLSFIKSFVFEYQQKKLNEIYNSDVQKGLEVEFAPALAYDEMRIKTNDMFKQVLEQHLEFFTLLRMKTIDLDVAIKMGLKIIEKKINLEEVFAKTLQMNPSSRELHLQYKIYHKLGFALSKINNYKALEQKMLEFNTKDDRQLHTEFMRKPDAFSSKICAIFISLSDRRLGKIVRYTSSVADMFGYNQSDLRFLELPALMPIIYAEYHQKIVAKRSKEPRKIDRTQTLPALTKTGFLMQIGIKIRSEPLDNELCAAALISQNPTHGYSILLDKWGHILNYNEKFHKFLGLQNVAKKPLYGLNIGTFIPHLLETIYEESKLLDLNFLDTESPPVKTFGRTFTKFSKDQVRVNRYLYLPELPRRQKEYEDVQFMVMRRYNPTRPNRASGANERVHLNNLVDSTIQLHSNSTVDNTRVFRIHVDLQREHRQVSQDEAIEGWFVNITAAQEVKSIHHRELQLTEMHKNFKRIRILPDNFKRRFSLNLLRPKLNNAKMVEIVGAGGSPDHLKPRSRSQLMQPEVLEHLRVLSNQTSEGKLTRMGSEPKISMPKKQEVKDTESRDLKTNDLSGEGVEKVARLRLEVPNKIVELPNFEVDDSMQRRIKGSFQNSLDGEISRNISDAEVDELFQEIDEEADVQTKSPRNYKEHGDLQFTERAKTPMTSSRLSFGFPSARSKVNSSRFAELAKETYPLRQADRIIDTQKLDTPRLDTQRLDTQRFDTQRLDTQRLDTQRLDTQRLETEEALLGDANQRPAIRPQISLPKIMITREKDSRDTLSSMELTGSPNHLGGLRLNLVSSANIDQKPVKGAEDGGSLFNPEDLEAELDIKLEPTLVNNERVGLRARRNTRSRVSFDRLHSNHTVQSFRRAMFSTQTPFRLTAINCYGWIAFFVFVTITTVLLVLLFDYMGTYRENIGISDNNSPYITALSVFTTESEKAALSNIGVLNTSFWPVNQTFNVSTQRMNKMYDAYHQQYLSSVDGGDLPRLFDILNDSSIYFDLKFGTFVPEANNTIPLNSSNSSMDADITYSVNRLDYLRGLLQLYTVLYDTLLIDLANVTESSLPLLYLQQNYLNYYNTLTRVIESFFVLLQPENQTISVQTFISRSMIVNLVLTFLFIFSAYPIYRYHESATIRLLSFLGRLNHLRIDEKINQIRTAIVAISNYQKKITKDLDYLHKEKVKQQQESFRNYSECVKKRASPWVFIFVSIGVYGVLTTFYVVQTVQIMQKNDQFFPMLTEFELVTRMYSAIPVTFAITFQTVNYYRITSANSTATSDFVAQYQSVLDSVGNQSQRMNTYFYQIGQTSQNYLAEQEYFDFVFRLRDSNLCDAYSLTTDSFNNDTFSRCGEANRVFGNLTLPLTISRLFTSMQENINTVTSSDDMQLVSDILNSEELVAIDTATEIFYDIFTKWNKRQNTELDYAMTSIRKYAMIQFIVAIVLIMMFYFTIWMWLMRMMKKQWLEAKKIYSIVPVELLLHNKYLREVFQNAQPRD